MRSKWQSGLVSVVLMLAACGGADSSNESTPSTTEVPTSTSATDSVAGSATLIGYVLEDGASYSYDVNLSQHITMTVDGDASSLGEDEFPGDSEIDLTASAIFTHTVTAGLEPETYEITISGEFVDPVVTGVVDGEAISELPEFAELDPVDVTVVVDGKGNVISSSQGGVDSLEGALLDPSALDPTTAPGLAPGQFLGPVLPDDGVAVGDSWEDEYETPGLGEKPIVTSVMSAVTGSDEVDGVSVLVVETSSVTSSIDIDLGELLAGFFAAFIPENATDEERAEIDAIIENLRFFISIDGVSSDTRAWVAPADGMVLRAASSGSATMGLDLSVPDEESGDSIEAVVEMTVDQELEFRLTEQSPG